jgi:hypothetical protein
MEGQEELPVVILIALHPKEALVMLVAVVHRRAAV